MSFFGNSEFYMQVARGLVADHSTMFKFGTNHTIGTGGFEVIWSTGGAYTGFSAAAQTVDVVSTAAADTSAGAGLQTVMLYGLDTDYNELSELVTMNGTSAVTTTASFLRLWRMVSVSTGSGGVNAGIITASQTTSGDVMAEVEIGHGQTQICVWTVPNGKTAYLKSVHYALAGKTSGNGSGRLVMMAQNGTTNRTLEWSVQGAGTSLFNAPFDPPMAIPQKTDLCIEGDASTTGLEFSGAMIFIVVDNVDDIS